ncbi:hypothetical protein [Bacillus paranthracis]
MLIDWNEISKQEKNEMIASKVLKWHLKEKQWFKLNENGEELGPLDLPDFLTNKSYLWIILECFDVYQITRLFPSGQYRTIIAANHNSATCTKLEDSICKAALQAVGVHLKK